MKPHFTLRPGLRVLLLVFSGIYSSYCLADQSTIENGKQIYNAFCIYCHGPDGAGNGPAAGLSGVPTGDLSNKAYMALLSDQELIDRVAYGEEKFPYLQMPGWRTNLNPEQIEAIIRYVRTLAIDKGPLQGPSPQERLARFTDDPLERGRIYYLRFCSACHGEQGDGDGWMASRALNKPAALSSTEIVSTLTYERVKDYITGNNRAESSYMPMFTPAEIIDRLDDIIAYIKTLPDQRQH
jgi:mono/diheme cytochrome c family protein